MRILIVIICLTAMSWAVELELKDGVRVKGDLICESKGAVTLKDGVETVQIYKKSIAKVDSLNVRGSRKFTLGEKYILHEKNEIIYINTSADSLTVRLRSTESGLRLIDKTVAPADSVTIPVIDGSYFETVRYWRTDGAYYTVGNPFVIETKCNKFARFSIELKGYAGKNYPKLKGPKMAYEKE